MLRSVSTWPYYELPLRERTETAAKGRGGISCPDKTVVACLSPPSEGGALFCRKVAVFSFREAGGFRLNPATFVSLVTILESTIIEHSSELYPLPVDNRRVHDFYY